MIPLIFFTTLLIIGAIGLIAGRRAELHRSIDALIDDSRDAAGNEINWQTTSSIDVRTNKYIQPYT